MGRGQGTAKHLTVRKPDPTTKDYLAHDVSDKVKNPNLHYNI